VIGGALSVGLLLQHGSYVDGAVVGLAAVCTATIGDLGESLLKRDLGVKDTGRLFGEHGGVLDRLDAAFFAVVVAYYVARAVT
jgi:phosphatidate cytidylyltransferase